MDFAEPGIDIPVPPIGNPRELPPIIRSRVGPQVVDTMSFALDAILKAGVHAKGCHLKGFGDTSRAPGYECVDGCPTGIAAKAIRDIGGLWNIAVTAGGG